MKQKIAFSLIRQPFVHRLYDKTSLTFEVPVSDWLACQALSNAAAEPGRYELTIQPVRKKRSLSANAYAWLLIGKLAAHYGKTIEEVYRENIKNVGPYDIMCLQEAAYEDFKRHFEANGLGYMVEPLESKIQGCVDVVCWHGSSVYNSQEMSLLINNLIQECEHANIYLDKTELEEVMNLV